MSRDTVSAAEVRDLERQGLSQIAQRTDELGQLGRVFQKMVQQLRVEIDQAKRIHQVAEIPESDYFQKLQQTAKEIRRKGDREDKGDGEDKGDKGDKGDMSQSRQC